MHVAVGPVLKREGGYAFDSWTPEHGLKRGYIYSRIEDAYYARKFELRQPRKETRGRIVACSTVDEFMHSMI
jgi:hypothetical protein